MQLLGVYQSPHKYLYTMCIIPLFIIASNLKELDYPSERETWLIKMWCIHFAMEY